MGDSLLSIAAVNVNEESRLISGRRSGNPKFLHAIDEGSAADVEIPCSVSLISMEAVERSYNQFLLDGLQADTTFWKFKPERALIDGMMLKFGLQLLLGDEVRGGE